jgi:ABC-type transport system involved in multi-copper enzyme maturation permease subunit
VSRSTGTYRAALTLGRRRGVVLLFVIGITLFGALAWGSYRDLNSQRSFLAKLRTSTDFNDVFRQLGGVSCSGGEFGPPPEPLETGSSETTSPSPETSGSEGAVGKPGFFPGGSRSFSQELECQFIGSDGMPIGPVFHQDPYGFGPGGRSPFTPQQIDEFRPQFIKSQETNIARIEETLGPRYLFETRVRALGTFVGTVFAVLLGATLIGAEFRWGVVRTLLTHEPRRGRVLGGKMLGLWTFVAVGFVVVLAVVSGVDVVMRITSHVHASGGPSAARIARQAGWAVLSLELWATMSAALAMLARVTIGGVVTLLATVGDHLLVQKFHWLRHFLPTQQVASLLPTPTRITTAYVWYPPVTGGFVCDRTTGFCREILFKPIPHWRASLVLVAWTIGFAMLAWGVLRARDVPQ